MISDRCVNQSMTNTEVFYNITGRSQVHWLLTQNLEGKMENRDNCVILWIYVLGKISSGACLVLMSMTTNQV